MGAAAETASQVEIDFRCTTHRAAHRDSRAINIDPLSGCWLRSCHGHDRTTHGKGASADFTSTFPVLRSLTHQDNLVLAYVTNFACSADNVMLDCTPGNNDCVVRGFPSHTASDGANRTAGHRDGIGKGNVALSIGLPVSKVKGRVQHTQLRILFN